VCNLIVLMELRIVVKRNLLIGPNIYILVRIQIVVHKHSSRSVRAEIATSDDEQIKVTVIFVGFLHSAKPFIHRY
jgi:hypothetical protein